MPQLPGMIGPVAPRYVSRWDKLSDGRYELLAKLASGGMADVYIARLNGAAGFSRLVVLKRIQPAMVMRRGYLEMFVNEAKLSASLHHANICQTYELLEDDQGYAIAMEFVPGVSMAHYIVEAPRNDTMRDVRLVVSLFQQMCEGLQHAHDLADPSGERVGLVHRDISPQNLMVTTSGTAKVLDFGIAKAWNAANNHTTQGRLKGKVAYMSPEQINGKPLDARSDVFSLAVVAFEAFSGLRLFKRSSDIESFEAILTGDIPPLTALRPGFPEGVSIAVETALHRKLDHRFSSTRAFGEAMASSIRTIGGVMSLAEIARTIDSWFGDEIRMQLRAIDQVAIGDPANMKTAYDGDPVASNRLEDLPSMDIDKAAVSDPANGAVKQQDFGASPSLDKLDAQEATPSQHALDNNATIPSAPPIEMSLAHEPVIPALIPRGKKGLLPNASDRHSPQAAVSGSLATATAEPVVSQPLPEIPERSSHGNPATRPSPQPKKRGKFVLFAIAALLLMAAGVAAGILISESDRHSHPQSAPAASATDAGAPPTHDAGAGIFDDANFPDATKASAPARKPNARREQRTFGFLSANARPHAEVFVDGKRVGKTPLVRHKLKVGTRNILLRYKSQNKHYRVVIKEGRTKKLPMTSFHREAPPTTE